MPLVSQLPLRAFQPQRQVLIERLLINLVNDRGMQPDDALELCDRAREVWRADSSYSFDRLVDWCVATFAIEHRSAP